jgi:hypothetical protein
LKLIAEPVHQSLVEEFHDVRDRLHVGGVVL